MSKTEEEDGEADEGFSFETIMAYTLVVVILTLLAQRIWDAAVRGIEYLRGHVSIQPGSLPSDAEAVEEEPKEPPRFSGDGKSFH